MGYRRIDLGQPLTLKLMLFDGDDIQNPVAHVYDSASTEIAGSPFALTHQALGFYKAVGPVKPAGVYDVVYIVYSDMGHSIESTAHDRVSDELDVRSASEFTEENVMLVDEPEEETMMVEECE